MCHSSMEISDCYVWLTFSAQVIASALDYILASLFNIISRQLTEYIIILIYLTKLSPNLKPRDTHVLTLPA